MRDVRLGDGVAPARDAEGLDVAPQTEPARDRFAGALAEDGRVQLHRLRGPQPAHHARQELAALGCAPGEELAHVQTAEQGLAVVTRDEEAKAARRFARTCGVGTQRDGGDRRVRDVPQQPGDLGVGAREQSLGGGRGRRDHQAAGAELGAGVGALHLDPPAVTVDRQPRHASTQP